MEPETEKNLTKKYGGAAQTIQVRTETVEDIVTKHLNLRRRYADKLDLSDPEALSEAIDAYLRECGAHGDIPQMEAFCSAIHHSRAGVYAWMHEHKGTQSASLIDELRTTCAAIRISAVDKGCAPETNSIFVLKNHNSYVDRVELEAINNNALNDLMPVEQARAKLLALMDSDTDEE